MRTRQGIRLWTVKQAPFLQGGDVPTWDFVLGDIAFSPRMQKRNAPGPFSYAPIIQGLQSGSGDSDTVNFSRGSYIGGNYYTNFNAAVGSIVFWWTPEFSSAAPLISANNVYLFQCSEDGNLLYYQYPNGRFVFDIGDYYFTQNYSLTAGSLYHAVLRWDHINTLDGTNHACLSLNDVHYFGVTTPSSPIQSPSSTMYIGSRRNEDLCASGIYEGFTIYQRPLYDGAYGIDAGNGDEINEMWNAGSGKRPEQVTGLADILFQLPCRSSGRIVTGEGEAYSKPANSLGSGGFMLDGTYTDDGWNDEGTPTAVAALATAEKIFDGGYKVTSDAANEGIYKDKSVSAGNDYVLRVIGHSDGTSIPKVILYDQDNTAEVASQTGTIGSTRSAPDIFEFVGEAPAGCSTLRIKLINTDATASDITYWHQCELLSNRVSNGSMEGTYDNEGGTLDVAPDWESYNCEAGDVLSKDTTIFHSGSSSQKIDVNANSEGVRTDSNTVFFGNAWHRVIVWLYGTSGTVKIFSPVDYYLNKTVTPPAGVWTKYEYLVYATTYRQIGIIASGGAAVFNVDDVSVVKYDHQSITISPANEAESLELGGIQVGGFDQCPSNITTELKAKSGKLRFEWTPRHGPGAFRSFGYTSSPNMFQTYCNAEHDNRIDIRFGSDTQMSLFIAKLGSGQASDNWTPGGLIEAGTTYLVEIEYDATHCTASFDGVERMSVAYSIDFSSGIPDRFFAGSNGSFTIQSDCVIGPP